MIGDDTKRVFTVYILQSMKDGKYYTGYSGDLSRRLIEHNNGKVKSTKKRRPLKLVFTKEFDDRSEACRYERHLKSPEGGVKKSELVRDFRNSSLKI